MIDNMRSSSFIRYLMLYFSDPTGSRYEWIEYESIPVKVKKAREENFFFKIFRINVKENKIADTFEDQYSTDIKNRIIGIEKRRGR